VVIYLERGADCLHMVQLMPLLPQIPIISCYWLTQVVLEKRPLNGCSSSSTAVSVYWSSALIPVIGSQGMTSY